MATVQDIINAAASYAGIYATGERLAPDDNNAALEEFNDFKDEMNTEGLNMYTENILQFNLVAGQQTRTIGLTGQWATVRPQHIDRANLLITANVRRPLPVASDEQWGNIPVQNVQGPPLLMYPNGDYPNTTIYFYPIPDQAYPVEIYVWNQFLDSANLTDPVAYPPGYRNLFKYNLGERLCIRFDRPVNPDLHDKALKSWAKVKANNSEPPQIGTDPLFKGTNSRYFDYRIGPYAGN